MVAQVTCVRDAANAHPVPTPVPTSGNAPVTLDSSDIVEQIDDVLARYPRAQVFAMARELGSRLSGATQSELLAPEQSAPPERRGANPASLHASARLRIAVRRRLDAPPRQRARRQVCTEARTDVRNCSRSLAHRVEQDSPAADQSSFAPEEARASGPGSDASRAEIGRDEVEAARKGRRPREGPSRLHGACRSELRANRCA
jgi:hypothetical protein